MTGYVRWSGAHRHVRVGDGVVGDPALLDSPSQCGAQDLAALENRRFGLPLADKGLLHVLDVVKVERRETYLAEERLEVETDHPLVGVQRRLTDALRGHPVAPVVEEIADGPSTIFYDPLA